jgi:hypothetical protein
MEIEMSEDRYVIVYRNGARSEPMGAYSAHRRSIEDRNLAKMWGGPLPAYRIRCREKPQRTLTAEESHIPTGEHWLEKYGEAYRDAWKEKS